MFLLHCAQFFPLLLLWLQANSNRVQEDLESEFTSLHAVLSEMKENMVTRIKQERASRTYELQVRFLFFFNITTVISETYSNASFLCVFKDLSLRVCFEVRTVAPWVFLSEIQARQGKGHQQWAVIKSAKRNVIMPETQTNHCSFVFVSVRTNLQCLNVQKRWINVGKVKQVWA